MKQIIFILGVLMTTLGTLVAQETALKEGEAVFVQLNINQPSYAIDDFLSTEARVEKALIISAAGDVSGEISNVIGIACEVLLMPEGGDAVNYSTLTAVYDNEDTVRDAMKNGGKIVLEDIKLVTKDGSLAVQNNSLEFAITAE